MKKYLFVVKMEAGYVTLQHDIFVESKKAVEKIGQKLAWLRYAKKTGNSYRFLAGKENRLEILQQISKKVQMRNTGYKSGHIADEVSYMVNNTVEDEIELMSVRRSLFKKSSEHLKKLLIELNPSKCIPGYSWMEFIKNNADKKIFLDLVSKSTYEVRKIKRNEFIIYEFSETKNKS